MALQLPSKVVATYFTLWGGGTRITAVPTDYNQIYLFHAVPAGGGAFNFTYGNSVNAAEIDQVQARGQRVVLTVGGANAGFNFSTRAQSDAFLASFKKMNDSLGGVDGCDFNNFEAFVGSSGIEMSYIAKSLKAAYGVNFSITCPPHPGGGYAPMDRQITKAMSDAGVLDYAGPQFYDSPDLAVQTTIVNLVREWVAHLGDQRKVVVGLSSNYGLANKVGPTLATSQGAWNQLVKEFPNLRGVFAWSAQDDMSGSWNFGKTMGPLVKSSAAAVAPAPAPTSTTPVPTPTPVPVPTPTTGAYPTWTAGVQYKPVGAKVTKANGKHFELYQVGASGHSDGTDPEVSTWYWRTTAAPTAVAPPKPVVASIVTGDKVRFMIGTAESNGTVLSVVGTVAQIQLNSVSADISTLVKTG